MGPHKFDAREGRLDLIKLLWSEFIGLFVDDFALALAVLLWLAFCWLILPHLALPRPCPPVLLFAGLGLILAESALRRAKPRAQPPADRD